MSDVLKQQVGGSHYKDCAIQPIEFIEANNLAFLEGCVIKRLCRHDKETGKGRQDIEKGHTRTVFDFTVQIPAGISIFGR